MDVAVLAQRTLWFDFGTGTRLQFRALLLPSDATTRLRFIPKANFVGDSGISFVAWDRTDIGSPGTRANITVSGGSTSFSTSAETALITVKSVSAPSAIGIVRNGGFYLDANNNGAWNSTADAYFTFGNATDIPLAGDWNGDGKTDIGVVPEWNLFLDLNGNRKWDNATDVFFTFGNPSDKPITGDWDGDGKTDIGTFRNGTFFLDLNGSRKWEGASDVSFAFGIANDIPIAGDWNGDGKTDVGTFRMGRSS
ncbi:MAG: VCBS repeat-containing protein [Planctomycetales bacterium]